MSRHEQRNHPAMGVVETIAMGAGAGRAVKAFKEGHLAEGVMALSLATLALIHRAHLARSNNHNHWHDGELLVRLASITRPRPAKIEQI